MTGSDEPEVGLCEHCRFARQQPSRRGGCFWRCTLADSDPRFQRYPPLPVSACAGFEPDEPTPRPGD